MRKNIENKKPTQEKNIYHFLSEVARITAAKTIHSIGSHNDSLCLHMHHIA